MNDQALITLAILDSNSAVLEGYHKTISHFKGFEVVHTAESAKEMYEKLRHFPVDILISDLETGDWDVLKLFFKLQQSSIRVKLVINAVFHPGPLIKLLLKKGVGSYLLKNQRDLEQLSTILRNVYSNGIALSSVVTNEVLDQLNMENEQPRDLPISQRECEVLACLCRGLCYQEIASELCITVSTVKYHVGNLVFKTDSKNYFDLTLKALRNSWVPGFEYNLNVNSNFAHTIV